MILRASDACGYTITLESVPVALAGVATDAAAASSDIGGDFSALRFYRRPPRGWRRHVRRLKAAGRPVPLFGLRRWSQRTAKREQRRKAAWIAAEAARRLRQMMQAALLFGQAPR